MSRGRRPSEGSKSIRWQTPVGLIMEPEPLPSASEPFSQSPSRHTPPPSASAPLALSFPRLSPSHLSGSPSSLTSRIVPGDTPGHPYPLPRPPILSELREGNDHAARSPSSYPAMLHTDSPEVQRLRSGSTASWKQSQIPKRYLPTASSPRPFTTVESYQSSSTALVAISTLGASVSWASFFTATRGSLPLLAWATAALVPSAVAASCVAIVLSHREAAFAVEHDIQRRRIVRAFHGFAAFGVLCGIILLNAAVTFSAPIDDASQSAAEIVSVRAAGLYGIFLVVALVIITVFLRFFHYKE